MFSTQNAAFMKRTFGGFYKNYRIHLMVWLVYILYESVISSVVFTNWVNPVIYLSHYVVFIVFFYIHADYALPWVLKFRKGVYLLLPLVVVLQGFSHMVCQYMVSYLLKFLEVTKKDVVINLHSILLNIYRSCTYLLFSTGYYFLKTYSVERKKNEELEKERLKAIISKQETEQQLAQAQHAFLKAQINPHFLFNTLDFIFHQVNVYSDVAGEAIVRLADMMRFALNSDQVSGNIELKEEIEQVENLLYLQAVTHNGKQNIQFECASAVRNLPFIPLVLLTLAENMLKHGDVSRSENGARISLDLNDEHLIIKTINLVAAKALTKGNQSGLNNVKKRLYYAYGDAATFKYAVHDHQFETEISVEITALRLPV